MLNSCTLSTFLNIHLNPEISKCCKGMCFSWHFRHQETMQQGKGRAVLEKTVCFLLELHTVFFTDSKLLLKCTGAGTAQAAWKAALTSWLLPFKMTFECDLFKRTHESGGREAESFPCPSPKFSQIPKRCCTWSFDNSVYVLNQLQANEKPHYNKTVMWIKLPSLQIWIFFQWNRFPLLELILLKMHLCLFLLTALEYTLSKNIQKYCSNRGSLTQHFHCSIGKIHAKEKILW